MRFAELTGPVRPPTTKGSHLASPQLFGGNGLGQCPLSYAIGLWPAWQLTHRARQAFQMRDSLLDVQIVVIVWANLCVCELPGARKLLLSFRHFRLPPSVRNADQAFGHVITYGCPSIAAPLDRRNLNPFASRHPDRGGVVGMQKDLRLGTARTQRGDVAAGGAGKSGHGAPAADLES